MSLSCAGSFPLHAHPLTRTPDNPGRHRRSSTSNRRLSRAVTVTVVGVARLGSLVTLSALIVLGGAAGALIVGAPTGHDTTVTVTFDGAGR